VFSSSVVQGSHVNETDEDRSPVKPVPSI